MDKHPRSDAKTQQQEYEEGIAAPRGAVVGESVHAGTMRLIGLPALTRVNVIELCLRRELAWPTRDVAAVQNELAFWTHGRRLVIGGAPPAFRPGRELQSC
jgi:hypothetical protein